MRQTTVAATTATRFPWETQFMTSVDAFVEAGLAAEEARRLRNEYIRLSHQTPLPAILDFQNHTERAASDSPYLQPDPEIDELMLAIFEPLLSRVTLTGQTNFAALLPALDVGALPKAERKQAAMDALGRAVAGPLPQAMRVAYG